MGKVSPKSSVNIYVLTQSVILHYIENYQENPHGNETKKPKTMSAAHSVYFLGKWYFILLL